MYMPSTILHRCHSRCSASLAIVLCTNSNKLLHKGANLWVCPVQPPSQTGRLHVVGPQTPLHCAGRAATAQSHQTAQQPQAQQGSPGRSAAASTACVSTGHAPQRGEATACGMRVPASQLHRLQIIVGPGACLPCCSLPSLCKPSGACRSRRCCRRALRCASKPTAPCRTWRACMRDFVACCSPCRQATPQRPNEPACHLLPPLLCSLLCRCTAAMAPRALLPECQCAIVPRYQCNDVQTGCQPTAVCMAWVCTSRSLLSGATECFGVGLGDRLSSLLLGLGTRQCLTARVWQVMESWGLPDPFAFLPELPGQHHDPWQPPAAGRVSWPAGRHQHPHQKEVTTASRNLRQPGAADHCMLLALDKRACNGMVRACLLLGHVHLYRILAMATSQREQV